MKPKSTKWNGHPQAYAHLKLDGHFTEVIVQEGAVFFYTSHPTDITAKVPAHIRELVLERCVDCHFLAELYVPGERASCVKTELAGDGAGLELMPFATLNLPEDAPLEDVREWFKQRGLPFAPWVTLWPEWSAEELMRDVDPTAEGYVLKDGNLLNWRKLKREPTIDLVVTGIVDGNGKHAGLIGSLRCSLADGREICKAGGMTDDERWDMSMNDPIGRVVEIAYQHVDSKGRLRHPRFVRFRDDKLPHECTADQDEELLNHG